jgi:hypothetical protein
MSFFFLLPLTNANGRTDAGDSIGIHSEQKVKAGQDHVGVVRDLDGKGGAALVRHIQRNAALVVVHRMRHRRRLDQGKGVATVRVHRHANGIAGIGRRGRRLDHRSGGRGTIRVEQVRRRQNLKVLMIATAATRKTTTWKEQTVLSASENVFRLAFTYRRTTLVRLSSGSPPRGRIEESASTYSTCERLRWLGSRFLP